MTETVQLASITPSIVKYVPVPPKHPIRSPNTHPKKPVALKQVVTIQECLMGDIEDPETPASARAQCARAWDVMEDRKRILRGKGLPQQVPPKASKPTKQPRSSFTESAGPAPVPVVPIVPKD